MSTERKKQTENLVLGAILTAIVVVLQILGEFIKFGPFSVSLVLIPIVIGAAKCGVKIGTWLGLVFGTVVLLNGDATAFFAVNVFGTVLTVLLKGAACGFAAGLTYKLLAKYNKYAAVIAAAVVCPLVNTGVFLIGCLLFFLDTIKACIICIFRYGRRKFPVRACLKHDFKPGYTADTQFQREIISYTAKAVVVIFMTAAAFILSKKPEICFCGGNASFFVFSTHVRRKNTL